MQTTRDDLRVRPSDAPHPPSSASWRLEIAVAVLGLLTGLVVAAMFLA